MSQAAPSGPTLARGLAALTDLDRELLYGRAQEELRVFVSSRMNQTLDDERRAAVSIINAFPHRRAWLWEDDAPAGAYHSEDECIGLAGGSDELVLILGADLSRVTRAEFEAARDAGAQRYILISQQVAQDDEVKAFIIAERETAVTRYYRNAKEFNSLLHKSLSVSAVRAFREQLARRRHVQLGPVDS